MLAAIDVVSDGLRLRERAYVFGLKRLFRCVDALDILDIGRTGAAARAKREREKKPTFHAALPEKLKGYGQVLRLEDVSLYPSFSQSQT